MNPDGFVASVTVLQVPQSDLGFDKAVEAAVKQWRYSPADDPADTTRTVDGTFAFELFLPSEWIYPAASSVVWNHTRALAKSLGFGVEKRDEATQVLVTDWRTYQTKMPSRQELGLPLTVAPERLQLHLRVTPGMEPARVTIGIILTARESGRRLTEQRLYESDALTKWVIARLSERVGAAPERLALSPARRAEQSRRLMPVGLADACTSTPAQLMTFQEVQDRQGKRADAVYMQPLIYPKDSHERGRQASIILKGEITEHGTLVNLEHESPDDAPQDLRLAAQFPATL